jgi:Ca-activated chloride channel family protein
MRGRRRLLAVGIVWCLVALTPRAQSQQAVGVVINGTVVDTTHGTIPGATVTLEQSDKPLAQQVSDAHGRFKFEHVRPGTYRITAALAGFKTATHALTVTAATPNVGVRLVMEIGALTESITVTITGSSDLVSTMRATTTAATDQFHEGRLHRPQRLPPTNETYGSIVPNPFTRTTDDPFSTFAADVDTASYANVRRFLTNGELPPVEAVRVEELLNYFRIDYPEPVDGHPVSITTEVGPCPWSRDRRLVLVGLRAKPIEQRDVRGRNIVLLIDVSGSMAEPNKLPLVKTGLRMFVDTLRDSDRVAIVVYAGASGLALPSTRALHRARIHEAIENLHAGGSTNGGQGLHLAYRVAQDHFIRGGINRVILATDGDFNVGVTDQQDLFRLIDEKKRTGIFLSVLGVGTGNLKDETMEMLADKGNGHYAYLDSLHEARRVLVREGGATLETVAKDVKFQVEFNPAAVAAYRLIGYENRVLAHQDFNDDSKDGGELGAGHTVTVLYEVVPAGKPLPDELRSGDAPAIDPLRYQTDRGMTGPARELATVKIRYKEPAGDVSRLMTQPVSGGVSRASHLAFTSAVAEFGLLLRDPAATDAQWSSLTDRVDALEKVATTPDRQSFAELVELAASLRRLRR